MLPYKCDIKIISYRLGKISKLKATDGTVDSLKKRIEELEERVRQLQSSEQNLKAVLENSFDIVMSLNRDYRIVIINDIAISYFKEVRGIDLAAGDRIIDKVSESLGDLWRDRYDRALSGDRFVIKEHLREGDHEIYAEVAFSPIYEEDEVIGVSVLRRDITEQELLYDKLILSQNMLIDVIDTIPIWVFWKETGGKFLGANQSFTKELGLNDKEAIIGLNDYDLVSKASADKYAEEDDEVISTGEAKLNYEETIDYSEDKKRWFMTSKLPLKNMNGQVYGVLGVTEEITDRKLARKKLEEQNERLTGLTQELTNTNDQLKEALVVAKRSSELEETIEQLKLAQTKLVEAEKMASAGLLLAGVAHEINNPLNFIQGGVSALEVYLEESDDNTRAEIEPLIGAMNEGVARVSSIVNSLNHFSRKSTSTDEECHVHQIIDNCLIMLQHQIKNRASIQKNYQLESDIVAGNEGKLHQVFLNILSNAIYAVRDPGEIVVETYVSEGSLMISVSDNGLGISKSDLPKITEPFFTTKRPGAGTGLGLAIVYSILEEHGGRMEIESEVGLGTKVKVILPIKH